MRFLVRTRRVSIPLVLAAFCLLASGWVGPIVGWLLVMAAFGFVLDAVLSMVPLAGNMESHRQ